MASWEDDEVNPFLLTAASPNINERAARNSAAAAAAATASSAKGGHGSKPSRGRVPQGGRVPNAGRSVGAGRGRGSSGAAPQPSGRKSEGPLARRAPKQRVTKASSSTVAAPVMVAPLPLKDSSSSLEDTRLQPETDARVVYRRHHTDDNEHDSLPSSQVCSPKYMCLGGWG